MKLIIAGGREYYLSPMEYRKLDSLIKDKCVTEIVSGGATGVDSCGEFWAEVRGLKCTVFKADWTKHGRKAGPIRNAEMAAYANVAVLFHGGIGTRSMYDEAAKTGMHIIDWR